MSNKSETRIRILIIERHEAVRRALRMRLDAPNHLEVIDVAQDLQEAAAKLLVCQPDVIVLGLHHSAEGELAGMVKSVRELAHRSAVIIILAPYADALERDLLMGAGAKRYLLKQIDSNQLIHEIESSVPRSAGV